MAGNYCSPDIICSPDPLVLYMMGILLSSLFSHFLLQNWLLFLAWLVFFIFHCNIFFKQLLVVFGVHFVDVAGFIFKALFNVISVILKHCWKLIPFVVKFNLFTMLDRSFLDFSNSLHCLGNDLDLKPYVSVLGFVKWKLQSAVTTCWKQTLIMQAM